MWTPNEGVSGAHVGSSLGLGQASRGMAGGPVGEN